MRFDTDILLKIKLRKRNCSIRAGGPIRFLLTCFVSVICNVLFLNYLCTGSRLK